MREGERPTPSVAGPAAETKGGTAGVGQGGLTRSRRAGGGTHPRFGTVGSSGKTAVARGGGGRFGRESRGRNRAGAPLDRTKDPCRPVAEDSSMLSAIALQQQVMHPASPPPVCLERRWWAGHRFFTLSVLSALSRTNLPQFRARLLVFQRSLVVQSIEWGESLLSQRRSFL